MPSKKHYEWKCYLVARAWVVIFWSCPRSSRLCIYFPCLIQVRHVLQHDHIKYQYSVLTMTASKIQRYRATRNRFRWPTALMAMLAFSSMIDAYEVMCQKDHIASNCRSEFIPSPVHVGFLVTQGLFLFPSKVFPFYNLPVFHTGNLIHNLIMWLHHSVKTYETCI